MNPVYHATWLSPKTLALWLLTSLLALASSPRSSQAQGLPGRRVPGGTRGETAQLCFPEAPRYFVPLLPVDNRSLTTAAQPTLFWYHSATTALKAELRVVTIDAQGKRLSTSPYQVEFTPSANGGVQHFRLPTEDPHLPPLAIGQTYQWQLTFQCDPQDKERRLTIRGAIQRIADPAATPATSPILKVQQAAQSGRWVDAFDTLLAASCPEPRNPSVLAGWTALLNQVALPEIATSPVIQCDP
ncbi:DUF928 domain-containing protein [Trichothermofontia sp.]